MGFVSEQLKDWKYLASKDNSSSSRGFYLFMAIGAIVLLVAAVVLFVVSCIGAITGVLRIVGFIAPIIVLALIFVFLLVTRD